MKNFKSHKGGNDVGDNNIPFIIFIILIIILVIGSIYILFFRKSIEPTPTPTLTLTNSLNDTSFPTPTLKYEEMKKKKLINIDLKNLKKSLENWGDDIDKLPNEIKAAIVKCYSNPDGCIF